MERPKIIQRLKYSAKKKIEPDFMQKGWDKLKELTESLDRIKYHKSQWLFGDEPKPDHYVSFGHLISGKFGDLSRDIVVHIHCKYNQRKEVIKLLEIYADDNRYDHKLEAPILFGKYIVDYEQSTVCGWHCIDQDFFFFTNLEAFNKYVAHIND